MKTILVVDDFSHVRQLICKSLRKKGYQTLSASTGQEAYRVLSQWPSKVNLVLSDFNMPDYSGFDLLRTIKNNPDLENIPVVFMTTEAHADKMRIARETGMASFIQMPYREEVFYAEIKRAINTKGSIISIVS